ncbi:hypothetical protein NKH77_51300 [Streptomyces sp. M19]
MGGDPRHEEGLETQRHIAREGGTALTSGPLDVTDEGSVRAALDSVWLTVRAAWPHLVRSEGRVLTVGSTAGLTGSVTDARTAHSASIRQHPHPQSSGSGAVPRRTRALDLPSLRPRQESGPPTPSADRHEISRPGPDTTLVT